MSRARGVLLAATVSLLTLALSCRAHAQAPDSSGALPSGLELLHLVPGDQPPLATLDPDNFDELREQFNADSNVARVILMMSPT